jgi:phospholipase/carboxylesterase
LTSSAFQGHRILVAEPPTASPAAPTVLILHGLGTDADDLASLAAGFDLPHCRFVLPDAPLRLPGYPEGAYAWYDFERHDPGGFQTSRTYLMGLMDRWAEGGSPLAVTGFSQGGVMALEAGLLWPGGVKGVCSMSGYLPNGPEILPKARAPKTLPLLLVHGTYDGVVPVEGSRRAGYSPETAEFPMDHTLTPGSLARVRVFLRGLFPA